MSPESTKTASERVCEGLALLLSAIGAVIVAAFRSDPLARGGDPVRHPEGREDPNEYA